MSSKPTYLGLLNAIAVGESRGYTLLSEWSKRARDPEVAKVLNMVAIREQEHAATFTKRLCELGYDVRHKPNDRFAENLECAKSDADDCEKFQAIFGYGNNSEQDQPREDPFGKLFDDESIDPQTGALLGRFIAEERDSGRRLRACYEQLAGVQADAGDSGDDKMLHEIAKRLDHLSSTLEELKSLRQ
jgi:rubrerythrin